jgi:periplasmic protein TonB
MHGMLEFSQCLTEGDPDRLRHDRKLRGFGVGASVVLQAGLLATIVIATIASPGVLPRTIPVMTAPFRTAPAPPVAPPTVETRSVPVLQANANRTPLLQIRHDLPVGDYTEPPSVQADPGVDVFSVMGPGPAENSGPRQPVEPSHAAPVSVSSGVMEGLLINRVEPAYPYLAKVTHTSGRVELRAIIGTDGAVRRLEVVSGPALLVKAAVDAVLQWRYRPTLLDGEAVEVATFVTVNFVLQQ